MYYYLLLSLQCLINQLSENDKKRGIVMEFFLMGINQTVKLRFKMYALYVFSLVVR